MTADRIIIQLRKVERAANFCRARGNYITASRLASRYDWLLRQLRRLQDAS